jgi:hypothetical protein
VLSFSFSWLKTTRTLIRKKSQLALSSFYFCTSSNDALLSLSFLLFHNFGSSSVSNDDDCVCREFFCEFFFLCHRAGGSF